MAEVEAVFAALAAGEGDRARALLLRGLARDPEPLGPWMDALAALSQPGTRLHDAAREGAREDDARARFAVGRALLEARLPLPAITFLRAADRLQPHEPAILLELATALEEAGENAAARQTLEVEPEILATWFRARYQVAFNAAMSGDLSGARAALARLGPKGHDERRAAARIRELLARADAVATVTPLDGTDLRGWHYVLTGGVLLHLNPRDPERLRGRYLLSQDELGRCLEALLRLRRLMGLMRLDVQQLLALPDRDSVALATAAGRFFHLPVEEWSPSLREPGLLVAYDLGAAPVATRQALTRRRYGQIIWSHMLSWVEPVGLTPEIVTALHQVNTPPWGPRLVRDASTGEVRRRPPLDASADELAARILAAPVEEVPGQDALDAIVQAGDVPAAAWRKPRGEREPLWFMGPVRSDRLA